MVEVPEWQLTGERQGRGRVYDQVESFVNGSRLRDLCADANAFAKQHDPTMPCDHDALRHTHLLCLYYSNPTKFGWHRDNGSHDGQSLSPVVSVSLGMRRHVPLYSYHLSNLGVRLADALVPSLLTS